MARKPDVRYWKSRNGYGCWIADRQHILATGPDDKPLGPTYTAAIERFRVLMAAKDSVSISTLITDYLAWIERNRAANTHRMASCNLLPMAADFGDRHAATIRSDEIEDWSRLRPSRRDLLARISAMFRWAIRRGRVTTNPTEGIERPPPQSRGAEAYLTAEQIAIVRAAVETPLRDFIDVLHATGARPGEIRLARGCDFDADRQAIVHKPGREGVNKTGRKTQRSRVILLSGVALEIVRRRVERYGNGYLFPARGRGDQPRTMDGVSQTFRHVRNRVGFSVTPYSFRHTYCTDWILSGRSVEVLAELIGSSPDVIRRHYQHLLVAPQRLRDHLEGFR